MQLTFQTLTGQSVSQEIDEEAVRTVLDLKKVAAQALEGAPGGKPCNVTLPFRRLVGAGGQILDDATQLKKAAVKDGDVLNVVVNASTVLAVGCFDGSIRVLDVTSQEERSWKFGTGAVSIAWRHDAECLAAADFGSERAGPGTVGIILADSGELHGGKVRHVGGSPTGVSWAPDGEDVATTVSAEKEHLKILSRQGAAREVAVSHAVNNLTSIRLGSAALSTLAWSPDGKRIAIGAGGHNACGGVVVLAADSGKVQWQWDSWRAVHIVCWSSDAAKLAVACGDLRQNTGAVSVLSQDGVSLQSWKVNCTVRSASWSPNSLKLAAISSNVQTHHGGVHIFAFGNPVEELVVPLDTMGQHIAWSPDGTRLAVACEDGTLRILSAHSGVEERRWKFSRAASSVAWSPAPPKVEKP
eukprot:TRINITY_DN63755_c0_g1_i1.p1 TRINITY_DN63755_c0_g1~~TRINITY_DN63755_c0_g1_i1.p1  ORF type:complete len:413 (+),score=100.17 TRINITY_DN63755_c0_g1_i1:101-1339(+)